MARIEGKQARKVMAEIIKAMMASMPRIDGKIQDPDELFESIHFTTRTEVITRAKTLQPCTKAPVPLLSCSGEPDRLGLKMTVPLSVRGCLSKLPACRSFPR